MFSKDLTGLEIFVSPKLDPITYRKCANTNVKPFHQSMSALGKNEKITEIPQVGVNTECYNDGDIQKQGVRYITLRRRAELAASW